MLKKEYFIDRISGYTAKVMGNPRKAAILLPLIRREGEWHILFEVRGKTIRQPEESSFPGGGIETGESKEEAAIRETVEELGIEPNQIEIIGEIDFSASENHLVYCFIGILNHLQIEQIKPDPNEVDTVYTVPLDYFFKHQPRYYDIPLKVDEKADFPFHLLKGGTHYPFYALERKIPFYQLPKGYEKYRLWGFTAGFVANFIEILKKNKAS